MVSLNAVLLISFLLFSIGIIGVLIRRNALVILMCVELMLNAANLNFIAFARHSGSVSGQIRPWCTPPRLPPPSPPLSCG